MIENSRAQSPLSARERRILALVRQSDGITRANLISRSGLTGTAVYRATEDLVARHYLRVGETLADGRGQPSHRIHLNADAAFTLGLSVMNDYAEAAILDLAGNVRLLVDVSAPGMQRADVIANTRRALDAAMADWLPSGALCGAGIAIAAFFIEDGRLMNPAAPLDDWALRDLAPELGAAFRCPVVIENIGNAAVIGEMMLGAGQQYRSFAYVNLSAGFGGGVVIDGRPWRGAHGNAGEFADILNVAGLFVPNLERLRESLVVSGIACGSITDLVANYRDDWPAVDSWIAAAVPSLRALARIVGSTIDIEALVLGGRLPPALAVRLAAAVSRSDPIEPLARRGRPKPSLAILPARISSTAAVIGAAALMMPEILSLRSPG